jgi:hypothetical protein
MALTFAAQDPAARASGLTPGDVVVYRVGTGTASLSSAGTPAFLDEYEPSGNFVESLALPTTASPPNKPLVASGTASSEGLLTLSADDRFLMATGYDAAVGTTKVAETASASVPRTVARVNAAGEIDTTTALTDAANGNNIRSATSSDGTSIWVGGAAGGVRHTTFGSSTSTGLNETDKNVREVSIFDGQLYTSADPTKAGGFTIATVGAGLPTTATQTISNLPFSSTLKQPYGYAFLTLGLGQAPDTLYVADNEQGEVIKFSLMGGIWTQEGEVAVPTVTGLTANDSAGTVTIFATANGEGKSGTLYRITDASGFGATMSGVATPITTAPANEAFRGVAFAPGTTIGSGGAPPPPAPTITPEEGALAAALGDETNPTLGLTVGEEGVQPGELAVTASATDSTIATAVQVSGTGAKRTLEVTPAAVGETTIKLTVEAPGGATSTTNVEYGVSAFRGDAGDRYYAGAGNGSSAIDVGDGYMVLADDESNVLRLYHERFSGLPIKTFDFTKVLPVGTSEIDIEASAREGDTLYWMGSMSNSKSGKLDPERDIVFAAKIKGSGAATELEYLGSYTHLREDMVAWDEANGNPLGLAASTANGIASNEADGFNVEGLEFAADSPNTAYVAFRAPLEPPNDRGDALLVPVTDFSSLVTDGNPGAAAATFGAPLDWNLDGRGIREIRKNEAGEYLVIAGTPDDSNSSFGLYTWDGDPADQPVLSQTPVSGVAEGAWESVVSVPQPLADGDPVELIEDNGDSDWYENGLTSKGGLPSGLQKDIGRQFTLELPAPAAPAAPQISGANPNAGSGFAVSWVPTPSIGDPTFTLEHSNASGEWSVLATNLTGDQLERDVEHPEAEGTWTYRVVESDTGGESEPSAPSVAVKVDTTPPNPPTATADRAPDFAGGGGWYKDAVTVSFAPAGDPPLGDGSLGSGAVAASVTAPETFDTDGSHVASGTVLDGVGNRSEPSTLAVQVDASPPSLTIACPANALLGAKAVATVTASDGQSGLASDPSATVPIDTSSVGPKTITRTAVDNVGHSSERSCTTDVHATEVISGTVKGPLTVRAGQSVELTATARTSSAVKVKRGGSLDVEGATLLGPLATSGASTVRICAASLHGKVKLAASTGPVVLGDGAGCAASEFFSAVAVQGNSAGVTIEGQALVDENVFHSSLKVTHNAGATTVTDNEIHSSLTVTGNGLPVLDTPNAVDGRARLQ